MKTSEIHLPEPLRGFTHVPLDMAIPCRVRRAIDSASCSPGLSPYIP